ncbi:YceI family protein [Allobranchiibius sp. CTAmp26]|uniref:YceI family protein n=1 Tax=Allobranchiibius sp. CTAmp26 TaxID=2815214 RepID=UPI001AA165B1|nr:YceI family protein [Allobranchiibius sp. CTAmp26]MBO1753961.1 polyisoprenoid-binding protein [Allobranchiibius sp. CTAmp26]
MSTTLKELNGTYTLDPAHSEVGFVARHAMVTKVRGSFKDIEGTASTSTGLQDAKINLTIQVASVDTRDENRDGHLRTNDFFDAEKFPTITFNSTEVSAADDDTLRVVGDLTIKETTKSVTIDFDYNGAAKDPFGNERIGFEGSTTLTRSEYGVNFNAALETGGVLVSDKITLQIEISAIKQA